MPFEKDNKFGASRLGDEPLDKEVIAFRGRQGQKEALKEVSDWQAKLRDFVDQLIAGSQLRKSA